MTVVKKALPVLYIISALAIIAGSFLPFVDFHYGYAVTSSNLFEGILGKVVVGASALCILAMVIKYTRVVTFLSTAITDGCAIVIWAQWKDKLVDSAPANALEAVYTRGYGYMVFVAGAIMLLVFGILCFLFVEED
ncbi:MAG: hypothetical protein J6Z43_04585 [Clostridiales bacterium]|jgi:hypothetical protein|nr:hypothetical protein [Clostridiales bacterium]